MGRPKKPRTDRQLPPYPEYRSDPMQRRRFMALLGGGAAAAALLAGCGKRLAGKVSPVPDPNHSPHQKGDGTAAIATDPPCDVTPSDRPVDTPPGTPPRPANQQVHRIPRQGVLSTRSSSGTDINYVVWIEYDDRGGEQFAAYLRENEGKLDKVFAARMRKLHDAGKVGADEIGRALRADLTAMYRSARGEDPPVINMWAEMTRITEELPVPGGITAPVHPDPPPPPLPGVPPRPRGVVAPRPPKQKVAK